MSNNNGIGLQPGFQPQSHRITTLDIPGPQRQWQVTILDGGRVGAPHAQDHVDQVRKGDVLRRLSLAAGRVFAR